MFLRQNRLVASYHRQLLYKARSIHLDRLLNLPRFNFICVTIFTFSEKSEVMLPGRKGCHCNELHDDDEEKLER